MIILCSSGSEEEVAEICPIRGSGFLVVGRRRRMFPSYACRGGDSRLSRACPCWRVGKEEVEFRRSVVGCAIYFEVAANRSRAGLLRELRDGTAGCHFVCCGLRGRRAGAMFILSRRWKEPLTQSRQ